MSTELWFSESSSDEQDTLPLNRIRKQIRDSSNPLEMDNNMLSKEAFKYVLDEIDGKLRLSSTRSSIPNIIKLAATIRFCAQGSYQLSIGNENALGLAQSTTSKILTEVFEVMESTVSKKWIDFRYSDAERGEAKMYFYEKSGIPGVIGCIDGTHIRIVAPKKELQHLYYNRKGFFSINALIACDHTTKIRFINAKHPGASHDSMVFNMSSLKTMLEGDYRSGITNTWLLGDAGYSLTPYLMTPCRNPEEGSPQCTYNKQHAKARNIIERTIGILKNRFRCLLSARALHYIPENATRIVNVCAALHNICLHYKTQIPIEEVEAEVVNENEPEPSELTNQILRSEAEEIRNEIISTLQHVI